ncbi:Inheritance of peroxisomes protein 1 [Penicillium italicum]|uniref:Inheritance of peroxisomes protein 1 n=1 Tax=Penicillium italicum TaxID=40296 RepID=A0A0A2LDW3_PENIT|nr:Inheritance of peroxisomes protein 1 [Penicillium italicum]
MPESPSELGQIQSLRRSLTLPTKLNPLAQRRSSVPNTPEHVIFHHPSAKIVHFSPRALAPIPSSSAPSDFDYPVDTIETLPWRSATERTVATAPLRLEKVHGSTAFLKCGNVVHAILKNSQCWCVDGASKFVLRIRPLTYYRIEIPYETEDDQSLVRDLKIAFPTVLRYEVTPCPFKRAFSVELPTDAITPRRKKAWQPKDQRERVPTVLEPPRETPSPSSIRSDCIDSVSTGDDTDGNLTDDSCFTSNKANSTILETIPDDRESSPAGALGPSPYLGPPRRSVSELPPTFNSLLAKFEATSVEEDDHDLEPVLKPEYSSSTDVALQIDYEIKVTDQLETEFVADGGVEAGSEPEDVLDAGFKAEAQLEAKSELEPEAISQAEPCREPVVQVEPIIPIETDAVLTAETSEEVVSRAEPTSAVEAEEVPEGSFMNVEEVQLVQPAAESKLEADFDISFASSPESFYSAEPQSPDSVSTHPTSVGGHDLTESEEMFKLSSTQHIPSALESTPADPCKTSQPPTINIPQSNHIANLTSVPGPPLMHNTSSNNLPRRFADAFSDTSPSMAPTSNVNRPSRFADASSDTQLRSNPHAKVSALNTDFDHMSTEFRRRAKATRERDVSPMPHPSALYQPSGDDGSSFISKAITLVLIPPAYLFVILLHIAARIVINPNAQPTITSTPSEPQSHFQQTRKAPATEDDFSFPLETQTSSEYEDAEISRKLNPWDLD